MFKGCFTALVTPFKDGTIDEVAFESLIDAQIEGGVSGVVPCGTTGESATLNHDEHHKVVDIAIEAAGGKVKVIAGTGSNSTKETILLTKHAESAGADAALLITPYYNKPTQKGLYEHYKAISEAVNIPLILYNVPGRTGLNMSAETTARLSELKNIVGIKEATGSLEQVSDTIEYSTDGFIVLSGDDATTLPQMAIGGHGTISVTSNVAPGDMSRMCGAMLEGKFDEARKLHYKLQPLNRAMFIETNPIPVKTALAMMGLVREEFRMPLTAMDKDNRSRLEKAMKDYGVI